MPHCLESDQPILILLPHPVLLLHLVVLLNLVLLLHLDTAPASDRLPVHDIAIHSTVAPDHSDELSVDQIDD